MTIRPWIAAPRWKALPEADRQAVFDEEHQAWVDWLNASPTRTGWPPDALAEAIRVVNPFPNLEEFYTWPNFQPAWKATEGNSSKYAMVIARPV